MFFWPTVAQQYSRTVRQRRLKTGALPRRTAGVFWWSGSSFLRNNLGPVWTHQKWRPLLVWEQTEWVSSSLKDLNSKRLWVSDPTILCNLPNMQIISLQLWSLGCFPVCSQMRRSSWSAMWLFMTFSSQSQVQKPLIYKTMCSSGRMVNCVFDLFKKN